MKRNGLRTLIVLALVLGACATQAAESSPKPKRPKPTTTTTAAPATTTTAAPATTSTTAPVPQPGRWVMGYYPEYQRDLMPPGEIDWSAMTHLVVGRVVPRADGSLDETFDYDATNGPALAADLAARARGANVVPILMVGGAGTRDVFVAAATSQRARLVSNLLATVQRLGFAGVDIDWEPIEASDEQPLGDLLGDLRRARPGLTITLPIGPVYTTFPTVSPLYRQIAPTVDQINVMTYGMAGVYDGWKTWHSSALDGATPSTPSSVVSTVQLLRGAGVPAAKLGLGVGFYGVCWTGGVTGPRQTIGASKIVAEDNDMSYTNIMASYFAASNYHFDSEAKAPYLGFATPKGPKQCTFVSYENADSIAAKGAFARAQGLGGAIVWTINQAHVRNAAPGGSDPLLKATRTAFGA